MLTKTITFGLGEIRGYDVKSKSIFSLNDETRKRIYTEIMIGFRDFARLCNYTTAMLYSSKILNAPLQELGYNTGYKPILEKMDLQTHLNGMVLNQAWGMAKAHFAGDHGKRLMGKGETVLPTHRSDGTHPICFHNKAVSIIKENKSYYILYNMFASKWARDKDLPSWVAFKIKFKKRDRSGISQLEKVINEEWGQGSGQLVRNKRKKGSKYLMHLVVKYEPDPFKELSPDTTMGIDLGVSVPAAIHFRNNENAQPWSMCIGNGRMMINSRGIVRNDIKRLLRGLKRKDSPLKGAVRDSARNKLRDLRQREKRIMKTASQKLASTIADKARRQGAGIWQMEDLRLTDMKEGEPWLTRNWSPGTLIDAIKWHAKQLNVDLKILNPRYTSQRCSKCGLIDNKNRPKKRKGASYFKCTNPDCGYEDHADKNAARNLSIKDIDKIISKQID